MRFCYSCMQQLPDNVGDVCPHCMEKLDIEYDSDMCLKPGSILQGKFIVGKLLGSGGFGNTYIGWNDLLKCKVAIKEYFPKQLSSREKNTGTVSVISDNVRQERFKIGLHNFIDEARSIANLQDVKGVVQVYTFFEENDTAYIVMEFLEGMDVKHILKARGNSVDYEWARRVILTILYTLREVHGRGVIHRDIAPDNIFVTNEGVIKLIDFGAAKYAERDIDERSAIVLKSGYAPIEQYGKRAIQGAYTDLYAVAALFYRMLTGQKPQAANERIQEDKLQTLSELGIHIPEQAELAIMTCLNIQPQFRLQSAKDFMEALDGLDFVPVYEPEWILPKVRDDQDTFANRFKAKIASMAAWQKAICMVGMLTIVAVIVAAGAYAANGAINKNKGDNTGSNIEKIAAFQRGKTDWKKYKSDIEKTGCSTKVTYIYDQSCNDEKVEATEPRPGADIPSDKTVYVTVRSADRVTVAKMTKKSKDEIVSELKNAGITSKVEYKYDYNSLKADKCYKQSKSGVVSADDIKKLKFYISWGEKADYMFKIPDLRNKTFDEAKALLEKLNKKYKCSISLKKGESIISKDVSKGDIISQEPKASVKYNGNSQDKNIDQKEKVPKTVKVTLSFGAPTPTPAPPTKAPVKTEAPKKSPSKSNKDMGEFKNDGTANEKKKTPKKKKISSFVADKNVDWE